MKRVIYVEVTRQVPKLRSCKNHLRCHVAGLILLDREWVDCEDARYSALIFHVSKYHVDNPKVGPLPGKTKVMPAPVSPRATPLYPRPGTLYPRRAPTPTPLPAPRPSFRVGRTEILVRISLTNLLT